jgi:hypothetical protein
VTNPKYIYIFWKFTIFGIFSMRNVENWINSWLWRIDRIWFECLIFMDLYLLMHSSILRRIWFNFMTQCLFFRLFYSFFPAPLQFFRISNFFGLSTTEETWFVEMRIWCIRIDIVLVLHLKMWIHCKRVHWFTVIAQNRSKRHIFFFYSCCCDFVGCTPSCCDWNFSSPIRDSYSF